MKFDYYTYHVSSIFATALINEDYTGLTTKEGLQLDNWIECLPVMGHFDIVYDDIYCICDITGLYSCCIEIRHYFVIEEEIA
jgi:hypothetical protein